MAWTNSVFAKRSLNYKIDYKSVLKTIPENSYIEPQNDKTEKIETRWRFLCIPLETNKQKTKRMIEISRKKPNSEREYLSKGMKWIMTTIDPIFDQFVEKQYFYYSNQ